MPDAQAMVFVFSHDMRDPEAAMFRALESFGPSSIYSVRGT